MSPAWGRRVAACSLALVAAAAARALPVVRKTPGGPWVTQAGPVFSVPAGQTIEWTVRVCSGPSEPITAQVTDFLHSGECTGHEQQELVCPPLTIGGGTLVACDDGASPPITVPAIDVQGLAIDVNQCADIVFATRVALLAPPGTQACNVAVYATTSADANGSGQTTPPSGSGCSCVDVTAPLPTQMLLTLRNDVDDPPFSAGDAQSTVLYTVTGDNLTPRAAEGRFLLPIPVGLELVEWAECPAGATCSVTPSGEAEVAGLVVPEGGSFSAAFRMRGTCAGVAESRICAQGWFEPAEDPGTRLLTDDPDAPGDTPTCFKPALPDLVLTKTWRLEDVDGSGGPTAGDRVRFLIRAWNRGVAPAREAWLRDSLPIGYDHGTSAVRVDPGGRYLLPGTAQWDFPEIGPGSVAEAWLETAMLVDAVAPNRAQLSTRVIRDCGVGTVLSDDPLTAVAGDATAVGSAGRPAPSLVKSFTFTDADGNGMPSNGEAVRFRIVARNDGTAATSSVSVTDALPACLADISGLTIAPAGGATSASTPRQVQLSGVGGSGGLAPDEEVVIEFASRVIDAVGCCNEATLTWPGGSIQSTDPRSPTPPEPTCMQPVARSVRLAKRATLLDRDGDGVPTAGDRIRWVVTAFNDGAGIPDLILTDEIPAGLAVDEASIEVGPMRPRWDFSPGPFGLNGAGRLQVAPLDLAFATSATVSFETIIQPGTLGEVCNRAGLVISSMTVPMLSEDELSGGPTCLTVAVAQPPSLSVELLAAGPLAEACALAGEELDLTVRVTVSGGTAHGVEAAIDGMQGLDVLDAGGGLAAPGEVSWIFGQVPAGSPVTRTIRVQAPCAPLQVPTVAARASASDAPPVTAPALSWPVQAPDVGGALVLAHDDTNGDGILDPAETVLATITLTEAGSCDVAELAASLAFDASLVQVVELRDGGVAGTGTVDWPVPPMPAGGAATLSVVLALAAGAPDCALPEIVPSASWPSGSAACTDRLAWTGLAAALPPGPCLPAGSDLLREDRVADLATGLAALAALLDPAGDEDSCVPGTPTRVEPGQAVAVDVGALLVAGIVLPGEAMPVGPGAAGQLVLYEISLSCDVIHACKVDADGNGTTESVRIGVRPCS